MFIIHMIDSFQIIQEYLSKIVVLLILFYHNIGCNPSDSNWNFVKYFVQKDYKKMKRIDK